MFCFLKHQALLPIPWDPLSSHFWLAACWSELAIQKTLLCSPLPVPETEGSLAAQVPGHCACHLPHSCHLTPSAQFQVISIRPPVIPREEVTTVTAQLQHLGKAKTTAALNPLPVCLEAHLAGVPQRHSARGD